MSRFDDFFMFLVGEGEGLLPQRTHTTYIHIFIFIYIPPQEILALHSLQKNAPSQKAEEQRG